MYALMNKLGTLGLAASGLGSVFADYADNLTATGTTRADAFEASTAVMRFTTVASGTGVALDNGSKGDACFIINDGANTLKVYPPSGHLITPSAADAAYEIPTGNGAGFVRVSVNRWIVATLPDLMFLQSGTGAVARTFTAKGRDVINAADFGVVGDYNPDTDTGTDDTAAIQAAFDALAASTTARRLEFSQSYYKITAGITIPANMSGRIINFQNSRIYYKGAASDTAAFLKQTSGNVTRNVIENLQFRGEDLCGYWLYVAGAAANIVHSENIYRNIEIVRPKVRGIQLGDYSVSGFDVDAATNTFEVLKFRLETGQEGMEIDADNAFSTYMHQVFGGGWGSSSPGTYIRQKVGSGLHIVGLFTGDNALGVAADRSDATYALDFRDGNITIEGWQVEGSCILKMSGFTGERRQVKVTGVEINDSVASAVPTYAIYASAGTLTLQNARLGRTIHPRMIYAADTLHATAVELGASADNTVVGRYELDHPERCTIEGRRPTEPLNLNPNPNFHLWWGSAADDLPIGYAKSALGTCTITRAATNTLYTYYTARVNITAGAAVSGQLIDGIIARAPFAMNTHSGAKSLVGVVRGKVVGSLTGTTAVAVRLTCVNAFASVNGSNATTVTPDANGNFTAFVRINPDTADPPVEVLFSVGLGVAGASGDLYIQTMHVFPMQSYSGAGGESWRATADAWTKYPAGLDLVAEHAKAGVTARFNPVTATWVRQWFASAAPTSGTYAKGSQVINSGVAAGGSPGWVCTTAGTPGTWKAMANVAA